MKVLIDIPDSNVIENTKSCFGINFDGLDYQKIIMNGTRISNNATNGDMIKAMLQIKDEDIKVRNSCVANIVIEYVIDTDNYLLRFDNNFWNAPYKGV